MTALDNLRDRVRHWWSRDAEHMVYHFLPTASAEPVPRDSYLRLWIGDLFIAEARRQGADVLPALRASVAMTRPDGLRGVRSTVWQAEPGQEAQGVRSGALTGWFPYSGGTVSVQACLYAIKANDSLRLAMEVIGALTSAAAPALASVAGLGEQLAKGIDRVEAAIEDAGSGPVLVLDKDYAADSATGALRPGHIVVINTPAAAFDVNGLAYADGRLTHHGAPLDGLDYLLIEIQATRNRDDWIFPQLDELFQAAREAAARGETERLDRLRRELLALVYTCADLTHTDQKRVAARLKEELEEVSRGVSARGTITSIGRMVAERGLPNARQVAHLTLSDLLD
ncbi:hypothetical protein GCM10010112_41080 [Actinoplanes lobatus]|uniref:Uncharacterized protein n=1 Tax=Actinoplanes lobatus TaxID=113568 RepID=A0A7W7HNG2_9ACTN|nr:hypothetical protein [Actinoplanes lobatus]MBB4753777.1 hypothetical protein [Actinoplanes lobatus]GGN72562.1 hypothetical protein GCM10010112_41080 [Actinoplanes lobatus]GIE42070.1 hypothetical protein Alo02nite_49680 [Actinoplanes lobatus]